MEISTGIIREPHFVLIYGPDGIGKTTFAASAPSPIIVGPESGSNRINTSRAKGIKTHGDIVAAIRWLRDEKHDFKSIGVDSLDWIEPAIWKTVCETYKVNSIEDVGYGKGYTAALDHWGTMISHLRDLRDNRGMNVIVIAHSQVKSFNDPLQLLPYDRHVLKLNDKASAKWREAVDAVLFANFEDTVFQTKKDAKAKASDEGGGNRKLFTVRRAAYDAKNRLGLPPSLPLDYAEFARLADLGQPDSLEQLSTDILGHIAFFESRDPKIAERIKKAFEGTKDTTKLIAIRNGARVLESQAV